MPHSRAVDGLDLYTRVPGSAQVRCLPDDVRGETNGDVSLVAAIGADASRDRIRAALEMEGVALDGVRFSAHGTDGCKITADSLARML